MEMASFKILSRVIAELGISDHTYLPAGVKLAAMSPTEYMGHDELFQLINDKGLDELVASLEVIGIASKQDADKFAKNTYGRRVIDHLINNSTFKESGVNIDALIAESFS